MAKVDIHKKILSLLMLSTVLLGGCGSHRSLSSPDENIPTRQWTIMVYMAADNNLEKYAIQDINELEEIGSTTKVAIVVEIDRAPGYDSTNGNWTSTRRYYVKQDNDRHTINSELVADLGECNMADPTNLSKFINWAVNTYPAKHYVLVLWDHGRGWQTSTLRTLSIPFEFKAINVDETSNSEMSLPELRNALSQSPRVDIILFDACLMGMLEVAYSIRNCADIMIASEDNIPATGQPYTQILARLTSMPQVTPYEFSQIVINSYMDYYANYAGPLTYSAIKLSSLGYTIHAVDQLGTAIVAASNEWPIVRKIQGETQYFDSDKGQYIDYKDLYDFASRLRSASKSATIRNACQSVMTSFEQTVLYQRNSGGKVANAYGISIYIPPSGRMLSQYKLLDFAKDTSWDEFLQAY